MSRKAGLALIISLASGVLGYEVSTITRSRTGRSPWGRPPLFWGLVWFLYAPLAFVLSVFARRSVRHRALRHAGAGEAGAGAAHAMSSVSPEPHVPAVPVPHQPHAQTPPAAGATPTTAPPPSAAQPPAAPPLPPMGWYPDPGGHYEFRWWDGSMWTPYVSIHGQGYTDHDPNQRIGPYPEGSEYRTGAQGGTAS